MEPEGTFEEQLEKALKKVFKEWLKEAPEALKHKIKEAAKANDFEPIFTGVDEFIDWNLSDLVDLLGEELYSFTEQHVTISVDFN